MTKRISRRAFLHGVGILGASAVAVSARSRSGTPRIALQVPNGTIHPFTSTSGVHVPPRGRSYMKFSFDFPEPSVEFERYQFGFLVFTNENVYGVDRERMRVEEREGGLELHGDRFVWAGGQQTAPGYLRTRLEKRGPFIEWETTVQMALPIKAVTTIIRGVPRGRISSALQSFFDPREDEVLLGYPFSGGDLFGPGAARGMETPLAIVQAAEQDFFFISSLDDRVRTKRYYFQPGERGYRLEAVCELEGWTRQTTVTLPRWRLGRMTTVEAIARAHFEHLERVYRLRPWEAREDVPDWLRRIALVVTLHGMHYTGYIFNDYARMAEILRWIAERIPPDRVLVFLSAWDGRYYWDYPLYRPAPRMGGEDGFRQLVRGAQALGFRIMPMFGANAANRQQPVFARIADAATAKIDGDRFDLNWVDWDNDRHQDGWLSYMNLGVASWREYLFERISEVIARYGVDAYFLDIVGGWVNNPHADMHEGTRRLVLDLRAKYPYVLACGEMHYDTLLEFIPLYHVFSQFAYPAAVQKYARFFQHLSHPAPGRGSTGVHEAGFGRWNPETLSLRDEQIPTLSVVDDTFTAYRDQMEAVIRRARQRAGI
jgi:hypothetical protein